MRLVVSRALLVTLLIGPGVRVFLQRTTMSSTKETDKTKPAQQTLNSMLTYAFTY